MPTDFSGTWQSTTSEGWDELLGKYGLPVEAFPTDILVREEITQKGDAITIRTSINNSADVKETTINVGNNQRNPIGPGVELEFTTAWDGGKLVMKQVEGDAESTREINSNGQMIITITQDGVVARSIYDRV